MIVNNNYYNIHLIYIDKKKANPSMNMFNYIRGKIAKLEVDSPTKQSKAISSS